MQLEFHQLDRRWEHLRVRHPARQRRLLASLAESGQQTPIVVVAVEGQVDRLRRHEPRRILILLRLSRSPRPTRLAAVFVNAWRRNERVSWESRRLAMTADPVHRVPAQK